LGCDLMGLFDALKKKPETLGAEPKAESQVKGEETVEAKFNEPCALCGKQPTEVKWMGQYWHLKCKRQGKKIAKRMM